MNTQAQQVEALRAAYEAAVIDRMKESGFLEVEIRVECLVRSGDTYQDSLISYGWWAYQLAALQAAQAAPQAVQPKGEWSREVVQGCLVIRHPHGDSYEFPLSMLAGYFSAPPATQGLDDRDVFERAYAEHAIAYAGMDAHVDDVVQRVKDGRDGKSYVHLHDAGVWVGWNLALAAQAKQAEALQAARNGGCGCCGNACADRINGCRFVHESPSNTDMAAAQAKQGGV